MAATLPLAGLALYSLVVGDPKDPAARKRAALVGFGVMLPLMIVEAFAAVRLLQLLPRAIDPRVAQAALALVGVVWLLTIILMIVRVKRNSAWLEVLLEVLRTGAWGARSLLLLLALHQLLKTQPAVQSVMPKQQAMNVLRDEYIAVDVFLPNGSIDERSITPDTVKLYRQADNQPLEFIANSSAMGDVIAVRPKDVLDPNTTYVFEVTSGVRDQIGNGFEPFKTTFTTGAVVAGENTPVAFRKVALPTTAGGFYPSITIGPDGKLYAGTFQGEIRRFDINPDGTLGQPVRLDGLLKAQSDGKPPMIVGIEFAPESTADNLVAWVTHTFADITGSAPDFQGKVSRLSGPNLENVQLYVTNLPRSVRDHVTAQPRFGPDGALYFHQPSNTAMGSADRHWNHRTEHLLTSALLRLDIGAVKNPPLDVKTMDAGGTYDPFAPGAPLTIYATGIRNGYDFVVHSNGEMYVGCNGSAGGGTVPGTPIPFNPPYRPRTDEATHGPYLGPEIGRINAVRESRIDYLYRIEQGGYYGAPNPTRHEYVLEGGNPTEGEDPEEVGYYPVGTMPDRNYRGHVWSLGKHASSVGMLEYKNDQHFNGWMNGKILVARYSGPDDILILEPDADGSIKADYPRAPGLTGFENPVDICLDEKTGNLYVTESGKFCITLLVPDPSASRVKTPTTSPATQPTTTDPVAVN